MTATSRQIREELERLISDGHELLDGEKAQGPRPAPRYLKPIHKYQQWYTIALLMISQLLPERCGEFLKYYENEARRKIDSETYTIKDFLLDIGFTFSFTDGDVTYEYRRYVAMLTSQIAIVESALHRLDSLLVNISGVLQAQLFDDELSAARHLWENGHDRAAGAVAGVVLEGHLKHVASHRSVSIAKSNPGINDWGEALRKAETVDLPTWRLLQRLADIRNYCGHRKEREPTHGEVDDLIAGTDKVIKTVF